uniref:Cytochrome c n=1 Tax=Candidatus Kentrum sp. FW TaxID=2126338 RepID=A0A450TMT8_9GAMM|nr:MAG: cytochrome c [Candidatus Kentron sp. FW]
MRKFTILAACAVLGTGVSGVAMADGAALYTKKLCNTCHGADGNTPIMPTYPKLAGQNAAYMAQQIKDIRDGKRTNGQSATMKAMVSAITDDEIKSISDHLASK